MFITLFSCRSCSPPPPFPIEPVVCFFIVGNLQEWLLTPDWAVLL